MLRKGSTCNIADDSLIVECPVERQIRYFVDFCPSLDPSLQLNAMVLLCFHAQMIVFNKLIEIVMPPAHCFPFTDKLCFESLLNSLSPRNIVKVVAALLQEQRILLVSTQMDTLTLCAEAFISLLYPFKWMHPLVPLLPTQLIEYLEAPTPYLMGVTSQVYDTEECLAATDGVVVVQLDYDKLMIPKDVKVESFPKSFVKKMEGFFASTIPPPSSILSFLMQNHRVARILYCDSVNPMHSAYLVFEVMFGPGKLGIKMKTRSQCLTEGDKEIEVVYLENVPDDDITIIGPGRRVPLLRKEPVILAVNGKSVIGKNHREVQKVLMEAPRPLTLRLQIGTAPQTLGDNIYQSMRTPSVLSPVSELPPLAEDPSSPETDEKEQQQQQQQHEETSAASHEPMSPVELSLEGATPVEVARRPYSPLSPRAAVAVGEEEDRVVRRYYRERSKRSLLSEDGEGKQQDEGEEEELDGEERRSIFVEQLRTYFLLELVKLLNGYEEFVRTEENVDPEKVFNTKAFLKQVDEESKPLLKAICKTQLFSHFVHDAYEYDDNYEVRVFNEVTKIYHELGDYTEDYVVGALSPVNWTKHEVDITPCDLRGLPAG